jgi:hypothetical protein
MKNMLKDFVVYLIYADDCNDCEDMRATIYDAIKNSSYGKEHCKLEEVNSETDRAVDLAIDNDIGDLPSCIIGDYVFCGKESYTYDSILKALEKTFENDSTE